MNERRIFLGQFLELMRFMAQMQARRGAEALSVTLLAVFFAGLVAVHIVTGAKVGAALALAGCGIGGMGQLFIIDAPIIRWPVIVVSAALGIASLAYVVI